ncbi:MAG TPA: hypothetical protein ENI96_12880 [Sedimenticola thiotaurini]|uniref:Uncharacterized protein n=1 Tax=Sedimenticola thiotaurini TaxID=1543721 RepID=A0A831W6I8_9GAMM|nr:hypothetical protein [Sedimenticola thiotaurini]
MRVATGLMILLAAAAASAAERTEEAEFQQRAAALGQSINADNSSRAGRCMELQQQIGDLRGRPQRRFTALEAYEYECQGGGSRSLDSAPFDGGVPTFRNGFYSQ